MNTTTLTLTRIAPAFLLTLTLLGASGPTHGQDWQQLSTGVTEDLNSVRFVNSTTGWVVGNGGTARLTRDGGSTWESVVLTGDDLSDVAFSGAALGLIAGDNGRIYRTVDGGITWSPRPTPTDVNLATVAFGAEGRAYAAGRDGTILRSADGGETWVAAEIGTVRYRRVAARGESAWVVGEGGAIRKTSDGGGTWFTQNSGTSSGLKDVCFVSTLEGFVAGQNNTLLHTADGGASWETRNTGIDVGLDGVFFGNARTGWAVGDNGSVFATIDGGLTWEGEQSGTAAAFNLVYFVDAFNGWVTGPAGMLLARREAPIAVSLSANTMGWPGVAGATGYDVVVGDLEALHATRGNVGQAVDRCLAAGQAAQEIELPQAGLLPQAAWFLVRPRLAALGSYDSGAFSQVADRDRSIAAGGRDCF